MCDSNADIVSRPRKDGENEKTEFVGSSHSSSVVESTTIIVKKVMTLRTQNVLWVKYMVTATDAINGMEIYVLAYCNPLPPRIN